MRGAAWIAGLALAVAAGRAPAQPRPPTPEESAKGHATAQAIIDAAGAADVFANESRDGAPVARHKPSGLYCLFSLEGKGSIRFVEGLAREDAAVCENLSGALGKVAAVRRAPAGATSASELDSRVAELRKNRPELRPASPRNPLGGPRRTPRDPQALLAPVGGGVIIQITVRVKDGWTYETRMLTDARYYAVVADMLGPDPISDVLHHPALPPSKRPPE